MVSLARVRVDNHCLLLIKKIECIIIIRCLFVIDELILNIYNIYII